MAEVIWESPLLEASLDDRSVLPLVWVARTGSRYAVSPHG